MAAQPASIRCLRFHPRWEAQPGTGGSPSACFPGVGSPPETRQIRNSGCGPAGRERVPGRCGGRRDEGGGMSGGGRREAAQVNTSKKPSVAGGRRTKASAPLTNAALCRRVLRRFKSKEEVTGQSSPRLGCGWEGEILLTARVSVYLIATWLHVPVEEGCR